MEQTVSSPTSRTRTLSGKFTEREEAAIKAAAARLKLDVSAFMRRAVLHETSDAPIDATEALLQLFIEDREASLQLGEQYTVAKFREICGKVKTDAQA